MIPPKGGGATVSRRAKAKRLDTRRPCLPTGTCPKQTRDRNPLGRTVWRQRWFPVQSAIDDRGQSIRLRQVSLS